MPLIKPDGNSPWKRMASAPYAWEKDLQHLLQTASAELIPADPSLDETHYVYAREVPSPAGPIDLVGIGSSGSVTLMECKLANNRQIKREVVGQVLDYAAALWETDLHSLVASFRRDGGADPFDALRAQFGDKADAFDMDRCRAEVERRLRDGDFRLLIAVDEIDADLRRIVQYVNRRAATGGGLKLVALAFPRYEAGATQVLVPESYGDELADAPRPPRDLTAVQQLHLDYWTAFASYLEERDAPIRLGRPTNTSINASSVTPSGFGFRAWNRMNDAWSGVEASPRTPDATIRFAELDRQRVEATLRPLGDVQWRDAPESGVVWIARDGAALGHPNDREQWPGLMSWMADGLEAMWSLFGPDQSGS